MSKCNFRKPHLLSQQTLERNLQLFLGNVSHLNDTTRYFIKLQISPCCSQIAQRCPALHTSAPLPSTKTNIGNNCILNTPNFLDDKIEVLPESFDAMI